MKMKTSVMKVYGRSDFIRNDFHIISDVTE